MSDPRPGNGHATAAAAHVATIPGMAPKGLVKDLANAADLFPSDFPLPAVIGHVAWMMSQAQTHKHLFLADLEWANGVRVDILGARARSPLGSDLIDRIVDFFSCYEPDDAGTK